MRLRQRRTSHPISRPGSALVALALRKAAQHVVGDLVELPGSQRDLPGMRGDLGGQLLDEDGHYVLLRRPPWASSRVSTATEDWLAFRSGPVHLTGNASLNSHSATAEPPSGDRMATVPWRV